MLTQDQIDAFHDGSERSPHRELDRLTAPARNSMRLALLTMRLQTALLRRYTPYR